MSLYIKRNRPDTWLAAVSALILRLALALAFGYVLYRVGFIIVVVMMAVMLALTMAPVVDWLHKSSAMRPLPRHLRRSVAASIVFILLAAALFALTILIIRPLALEIQAFMDNWAAHRAQWEVRVRWLQERYAALPPDVREWLLRQWADQQGRGDMGVMLGDQIKHLVSRTLESGMLLVEMILIPVLAFSFLTESRPLKRELAVVLPAPFLKDGLHLCRQTGIILQSYAIGQLILALIAGVVVYGMMLAMDIRYALVLAVIAAVTRVIPVIGPIVGGIPIVLMSALQGWERGVAVLIAFSLMHLVESKVVMPRLIGYRIKLHPAVVIIVLLIGAEFFGMWGMFLAAPVAAVVKVMFYHFLVRPRRRTIHPELAPPPPRPREREAAHEAEREAELERAAVGGARRHSGAH